MATTTTTKKRSFSDRHLSDAPLFPKVEDNDAYRMMVLRYTRPEEEVDRKFLQKAVQLGIDTTQDLKTSLDLATQGVHSSNFDPISPEQEQAPLADSGIDSRKSQSIHASSDSSVDSRGHRNTPSLGATSITSVPSTESAPSDKSSYLKFKRGLQRFSTIRGRKKTLRTQPSAPDLPFQPLTAGSTYPDHQPRSSTADRIPTVPQPQSPIVTSPALSPSGRPTGRRKVISMSVSPPIPAQSLPEPASTPSSPPASFTAPPHPAPPPPRQPSYTSHWQRSTSPGALDRSLADPRLRKLRTLQLQEQLRFISFRASQTRLMRTRHLQHKRDRLAAYKATKAAAESRHAEVLSDLEHRHFCAEEDLQATLETERHACDTRLKHMQAYCNPQENIQRGMPARQVTQEDHIKLQSQYQLRNQMGNLHASRINVLRERQAKQMERITEKQEKETEKLAADFGRENEALDANFEEQEHELEREFQERKNRLVHRWAMAEAIERKTLELETGETYGPLPEIGWGDEGRDGEEAEGEIRRLLLKKKIMFDPEQGFTEMDEPVEDGEDATAGAQEFDEFDSGNVI